MLLADHFAALMAIEIGRDTPLRFSTEAVSTLETYCWPGNISELKNLIERTVYRTESDIINKIELNPFTPTIQSQKTIDEKNIDTSVIHPLEGLLDLPTAEALHELETRLLKTALANTKFNQRKAAEQLGLTYHQFRGLYRKLKDSL